MVYVTPLFKEVLGNNDANKPAAERLYDPRKPDAGRLAVLARELADIARAADDSRPVTSALSFPELSNRTGYADALDVVGYNYREGFSSARSSSGNLTTRPRRRSGLGHGNRGSVTFCAPSSSAGSADGTARCRR